MAIDEKHTEEISALQKEIQRLTEENEQLRNIQQLINYDQHINATAKASVKDYLLQEYALNNSEETMVMASAKGEILNLNDTLWRKLGYASKEELLHKPISIIDPNFEGDTWPLYWSKLKQQNTFSFFSYHKTKEGTRIPVEITSTYLRYQGEEYCIGFAKDVSNLKAAEELVLQTELVLNIVMTHSSESIALSSVEDENVYRLVYINSTNLRHINAMCGTNYTEKDLVGKLHDELFLKMYKSSQEEFELDNKKRNAAIQQKKRKIYEESYQIDGLTIHLESCITPVFNQEGICTHTLWSARDITERKKIEEEKTVLLSETLTLNEELKSSEEELRQILDSTIELNAQIEQNEFKLRSIFDNTISINYLLDLDAKIMWFNRPANESVKQRLHKELKLDHSIKEFMYPHLYEGFDRLFALAKNGETATSERKLGIENDEKRWIQTSMMPVYKDKEKTELMGIYMTITDISDRKKKEDELMQVNKELVYQNDQLNQYSYIVSHNLRGPIATILGITNIFSSEQATPQLKEELIAHIQKSTSHLDTIIRDLNMILSQTKETDHTRAFVDLGQELSIIKDLYEPQIEKAEATIKANFSEAPAIFAIKSFIHSILSNLISNSLKYKKPNEPVVITIQSKLKEENTLITYTDNGLGIDLKLHKEKIFGFYKRFHTHVEGKGMGLHLIKTQVEMMGGRIDIDSEVNKGTTFMITLKHP